MKILALIEDRTSRLRGVVVATVLGAAMVAPVSATAKDIGPDDDFCGAINSTPPGEEVVLAPGEYQGPCAIRQGGERGMPLIVRAADPKRRPRIVYGGTNANALEVKASNV